MFDDKTEIVKEIFLKKRNIYKSSHQMCSEKKVFLKFWQNSQAKTCSKSLFNKVFCDSFYRKLLVAPFVFTKD